MGNRVFSGRRSAPMRLLVLLVAVFPGDPAGGAEIDSLTWRQEPMKDSQALLDARFNKALSDGIVAANEEGSDCDRDDLYDSIQEALATPFIGHGIAVQLDRDERLDRHQVLRAQSIYQDLGWLENPSVHLKDLAAVIRIGDTRVGVDKLGHFFVEGWKYFEKAVLKEKGIDEAVAWGEFTERTYFGNLTTGVYSYADLVANFEGMRFWLRLLGSGDDPLALDWFRPRPYVVCRRRFLLFGERRWYRLRRIHLLDYVNPAWDEAVNCPMFRTPEIEALVIGRIDALEQENGVNYRCPVDPEGCIEARDRYGRYAPHLLHPSCLAAENP